MSEVTNPESRSCEVCGCSLPERVTGSTCETCERAARLMEREAAKERGENAPNHEPLPPLLTSVASALAAGGVVAGSWMMLGAHTPWLPSFLWCFLIGAAVSATLRPRKEGEISAGTLAALIPLLSVALAIVGVFGVRARYINQLNSAMGLPTLPLVPDSHTIVQIITAGETPLGMGQLMVLTISALSGAVVAGLVRRPPEV